MLSQKGVEVTIFVSDYKLDSLPEDIETTENITIVRFNPKDKPYYKYLGHHAALSYHFSELVIDHIQVNGKPDYIETQDYQGIGYYLLQQKRLNNTYLTGIPIILTLHSPSYFYHDHCRAPLYKLPDFWIGEMEKWTMRAADIFISPSHYLAESNSNEIGDKFSEYNFIPNPYYTSDQKALPGKVEKGDIVFFGKLTYQKGGLELIKFMVDLWDEGFPYSLKIIGDDHYFDLYQSGMKDYIIKKYKKYYEDGKIIFEGKLAPNEINPRISKADIIIIPSIVDNFPYTVVESMMLGKVLLVSDGGGQREIIEEGKSGFVYQRNTPGSFASQLKKIVNLTPEQYENISKNATERIKRLCSYDSVFNKKMEVLKNFKQQENVEYPFTKVIPRKISLVKINSTPNLLSIVIPYYNSGPFLEETIENIYKTNYQSKEVIIVNDGSNQKESLRVLDEVAKKYPVKVVSQKNMGLPGARNTGANYASGEFLAFLDADDKVDPDYHNQAIRLLKQYNNISFIGCWVQYFDASEDVWPTYTPEPPYLLVHNPMNTSSLVYKRADFITSGINDMDMMPAYEDYESIIHLTKNGFRGIVIPELFFIYRVHPNSLFRTFTTAIHLDAFRLLTKKHKEFFQEYSTDIINILQANGPSHLYNNPTFEPQTDVIKLWDIINKLQTNSNSTTNSNSQSNYDKIRNMELTELLKESQNQQNLINTIKEWYHNEYEVLPLWYKRFGHIIKIVTGKKKLTKSN